MMQNYQDAMALFRAYVNLDLFITFTSNPQWPEITEMLAFHPGQKPHKRPEVGTRVFKMNLTELLDDLTKREVLARIVQFQKHGLPHARILLWLEEEWKCKTLGQIDDIISAEMPSPIDDPEGYKVVTEYMLHDPCGKGAACTIEGKCSKKFPKPFYAKTMIDEDGYPVYRQRDSMVRVVKGKFTYDNKGSRSFEELMTINERLCTAFKEACFAYGVLIDDKEWAHAIKEASLWALGPQLHDLFVTMLLFCDVSRQSWETLSEDILHKKRKLFKYLDLHLTEEHIKNYCALEIETLLNRNGRSLTDFQDLPQRNPTLLTNMDNQLIREALDFDIKKSKLHSLLNPKQRAIYEEVIDSIDNQKHQFYFVYGPGGTWKTFLYKTIIARLRSKRKIVLAVASSGLRQDIDGHIGIKKPIKRKQLLWRCYGVAGGDFRQILPVIPKGKRPEIVQACINMSELWKSYKVFRLTHSMRVNEYSINEALDAHKLQFNKWVLDMGDETLLAKKKKIKMRKHGLKFLKNSLTQQTLLLSRLSKKRSLISLPYKEVRTEF
ncbi:ATP-dependent DNA helicase PIF1-like protein [Tanacetum coccineum]